MKNFNPIRGTNDYMPRDAKVRELVKEKILNSYQSNGYNLIQTPILESLDFLDSSDGGDNLKLIFRTIKRGDKLDLTKPNLTVKDIAEEGLRYDLTVPLARFYANNREKLPTPFKAIQIDYSFRAERPQRGRDRQFIQCDIDVFGDKTIMAELELMKTTIDTYNTIGFDDLTVKVNDRRILNAIVLNAGFEQDQVNTVCVSLDKIDKISLNGVMMELIEKGFDIAKINTLVDSLNDVLENGIDASIKYGAPQATIDDIKYLINNLSAMVKPTVKIVFDISIVRGQGYYTGTVFEYYTNGFGGAIGGGGRYDTMIGKITGQDVPAVGGSIGFEPVTMLIKERGLTFDMKQNLALIYDVDDNIVDVYNLKKELTNKYNVSLFVRPKNMKNFYEKVVEVADLITTFKDVKQGNEIKVLNK